MSVGKGKRKGEERDVEGAGLPIDIDIDMGRDKKKPFRRCNLRAKLPAKATPLPASEGKGGAKGAELNRLKEPFPIRNFSCCFKILTAIESVPTVGARAVDPVCPTAKVVDKVKEGDCMLVTLSPDNCHATRC